MMWDLMGGWVYDHCLITLLGKRMLGLELLNTEP